MMTDFSCAMFFSKIISINGIIVQALILIVSHFVIQEKYQKLKKIINISILCLLVLNAILVFDGRFTERSIDDFKGMVYIGQAENGEANGWGRLYDENRNIIYMGYFHNNKYEGKGNYYNCYEENGGVVILQYEGRFKNGEYHGDGKYYIYANGESLLLYEGEFRNNQYCGIGTLYFYDDDNKKIGSYEGGMAYNNRYGFGVYEYYNSDTKEKIKYEGTFAWDEFDGWGILYSNDKIEYIGYWADSHQEGKGTLYYTDDSGRELKYVGGFSEGKFHGHGKIYDAYGNIIQKGQYKNGTLKEGD